ncbi:hypothetical protein HYE60_01920 [Aggregatibacter actinomycetemcomitans]|uniref:hypothetical protein n=1 Tax=Aggregatibacter actinomycetemcomitans TaxID=714 RepID=UPI00197B24BB|nr:hypothetical protein [Aggregatibacter actinomycetemcomitans]MBN6074021.1 hypothetical protein [Aggregatibacter actinomycetemcomitans]
MNKEDAINIINKEGLDDRNFFDTTYLAFESTVIEKSNNNWIVYIYGEKGGKEGLATYNNESDALIDYIKRLRAEKRIELYYKKRSGSK